MSSPYWQAIERTYKAELNRSSADVLRYMIHRADFQSGRCAPGLHRILIDLGMGMRTFLAAREHLRQLGHLAWVQRKIAGRYNDTTEYRISREWLVLNDTNGVGAKRRQKHTTLRPRKSKLESPRFNAAVPPDRRCPVCGAQSAGSTGRCFEHLKEAKP